MNRSKIITEILNGTYIALNAIMPIPFNLSRARLLRDSFDLNYGVSVGLTGDLQAKLIMAGKDSFFGILGNKMFGVPIQNKIINTISEEIGSMFGSIVTTNAFNKGIQTNITIPTVLQGETKISSFDLVVNVTTNFVEIGDNMDIYLILDK